MLNLKNKTKLSYLNLLAIILSLIVLVMGFTTHGFADQSFDTVVVIMLIASLIVSLLAFILDFDFMPLIACLFASIAFCLIVYHSLPIFADKFNDLNFRNGNFTACLWYTIISGIGLLSSVITCFDPKK